MTHACSKADGNGAGAARLAGVGLTPQPVAVASTSSANHVCFTLVGRLGAVHSEVNRFPARFRERAEGDEGAHFHKAASPAPGTEN